METILKAMEEQTRQIKRLADNKATEVEDIGRGNISEATEINQDLRTPVKYQGDPRDQRPSGPSGDQPRDTRAPKVCKKLVKGLCAYGLSGIINGERCPEPHPRPCEGWRQRGREGCSRGNQCRYYHQPPCQTVANSTLCENGLCQFIHLPMDQLDNPPTLVANQGYWDGNRFRINKPKKADMEWTGLSQAKKDATMSTQSVNNNWQESQLSQGQQKGFGAIPYQQTPMYYQGPQLGFNNLVHPTYSQGTQPTYTQNIPTMYPGTGMMINQQRAVSQPQIISQQLPGSLMNQIPINHQQLAATMPGQIQPLQQTMQQNIQQPPMDQQTQGQDQFQSQGPMAGIQNSMTSSGP